MFIHDQINDFVSWQYGDALYSHLGTLNWVSVYFPSHSYRDAALSFAGV